MSTQSSIPEMRGGIGLSVFSLLIGLLLALQHILSPVVFASSSSPERVSRQVLTEQGVLDLAGVSVVRLVVTYTTTQASIACTGLGTLLASWSPTSLSEHNTWVLTDGTLISQNGQTCASSRRGQLTSIQVYANNAYTDSLPPPVMIGQLTCRQGQSQQIACGDSAPETLAAAAGAVLFSFHSDPMHLQPFLRVAPQQSTGLQLGIELEDRTATVTPWPPSPVLGTSLHPQTFLTPKAVNTQAGSQSSGTPGSIPSLSSPYEPGMPILNNQGNVIGMNLTGGRPLSGQAIVGLLSQQPEFQPSARSQQTNSLNIAWQLGVQQYESGDYAGAQATLQQIATANPQFRAASAFEHQAAAKISHGPGSSPTGAAQPASGTPGVSGILLIVGLIAGLIVLILLLVLVTLLAGRARRHRQELARFEAERVEAQRNAEIEAQQMQLSKATAKLQPSGTELSCPNCGALVQMPADLCPQCKFLLSPSASGLRLHATPPPSVGADLSGPQPHQLQPQANNMQPSDVRALPISDQPTIQFSPSNGSMETETTLPYSIQQFQDRNLSLAVGHLTDPGIKRKHKPNEDSLFAMQGARTYNSLPQQFGLFVVADGMGGHASGQDASRLAIQTIINYVLPRISSDNQVDDQAFLNLLLEGVQQANQAVHQRNLEERADMGTTMTAALIVGSVAYIANVGDSRTYLYREPEGLTKITQDHSVVASLVEAGIIKPDDIYTHPKRNQIYRSLGEKPSVDVDLFRVPLQPADKLLLCSDGLWDMVRDPEIQRLMSTPTPDPSQTGRELIQAALNGGGEDNVSVIVVSISEAPSDSQVGMTGIQLLAKPENVTVPDLSTM
jgi:serine/threonine protein phosphatase PrpC/rubrerythrin